MTQRRSWTAFGLPSKRFPIVSPLARYRRVLIAAMAAGAVCALASGCDGGHDDVEARSETTTAMLPGTRAALAPQASARAQQFDTGDGTPEHAASDALLPPVMHTAD
ncbi:hypothetical protein AB1286_22325 [Trinickia sp. NRRL B-1857]|uniref:hypothetical protein n=1 Tax=Trinickia sp. NRRL B-1857 TaxID=3162879 RepID=UPI003D2AEA22